MSDDTTYTRRTVLRASAATAVAGGGFLAGCTGGDGNDGGSGGTGDGGSDGDGTDTPEDGGDGNGGDGNGGDGGGDEEWRSFMEDANNFDGEAADVTGEDAVTVQVGAGQGFAFDPAAVRVSTGTTVTWEWTGEGSQHNVVAEDGTFESELKQGEGETFEYTFEEAATHRYVCEPHLGAGMLGVVIVE